MFFMDVRTIAQDFIAKLEEPIDMSEREEHIKRVEELAKLGEALARRVLSGVDFQPMESEHA